MNKEEIHGPGVGQRLEQETVKEKRRFPRHLQIFYESFLLLAGVVITVLNWGTWPWILLLVFGIHPLYRLCFPRFYILTEQAIWNIDKGISGQSAVRIPRKNIMKIGFERDQFGKANIHLTLADSEEYFLVEIYDYKSWLEEFENRVKSHSDEGENKPKIDLKKDWYGFAGLILGIFLVLLFVLWKLFS